MGDIWFISFISHDGSCSLCVVLPDLSHYVFACAHIFLVCVYVIYRYIVIDRLMSLCMHGVPPLCTASACVCVRACVSDAWTVTCAALQAVTYQTYQCLVSTCVYIKLRVCRHIRTHSSHCG